MQNCFLNGTQARTETYIQVIYHMDQTGRFGGDATKVMNGSRQFLTEQSIGKVAPIVLDAKFQTPIILNIAFLR